MSNQRSKVCPKCKLEKVLDCFRFRNHRKSGARQSYCNPCQSQAALESKNKHREAIRIRDAARQRRLSQTDEAYKAKKRAYKNERRRRLRLDVLEEREREKLRYRGLLRGRVSTLDMEVA